MSIFDFITSYFLSHSAFVLYLCLGLGYVVGKLKIKAFTFGATTGTLLVGLIIGQFVSVEIQQPLNTVLYSLFCFTVGFEVGPTFFSSIRSTGLKIVVLSVFFALVGLGTTFGICKLVGLDVGNGVGIMAGALTQTSIVGAAQLEGKMASDATIAYALTYVFGTIGAIVFVKNIAPLILGKSLPQIAKEKIDSISENVHDCSGDLPDNIIQTRSYIINSGSEYCKKTVDQFELKSDRDIEVEAIYRGDEIIKPTGDTVLLCGDVIQLVGNVNALNVADEFGLAEVSDPRYYQVQLMSAKIVLTDDFAENGREILSEAGILVRENKIKNTYKKNSIISVVGPEKAIKKVAKKFGYIKDESDVTDITFLALMISVGLLLGSFSSYVGESVGVLLTGMVCGWWCNRRPRVGRMPAATRLFLKSLGLNLYIASLALMVGGRFQDAMADNGWIIILLGLPLTIIPHLISLLFGKYVLRIDNADLLGGLCGSGTCTAALNSLIDETDSSIFNLGYAPGCAVGNVVLTLLGVILPLLL